MTAKVFILPLAKAARASARSQDLADFHDRFPPLAAGAALPTISWEALRRQLEDLAISQQSRALVFPMVENIREEAASLPSELLLRKLLILTGMVMDPTFHPPEDGEVSMS